MKILIVGDFHSNIHEKALYDAFLGLGHDAYKFSWQEYFQGWQFKNPENSMEWFKFLYFRIQNKFLCGPVVWKINKNLLKMAEEINPELIFIYRGTHIFPATLRGLKKTGAVVFGYNNDDPFSPKYRKYVWRHFINSINYYDHIFAYRKKNIDDYQSIGYSNVSLLRSYYIKESNCPTIINPQHECEVVFLGHYEDDGRDIIIKHLFESEVDFRLYGPEWHHSIYYQYFLEKMGGEIKPLRGEAYNQALASAKIALVFLSKLNNDTYTRRSFEIPAARTFMLSEYSADLDTLFKEGIEAEYFRNEKELFDKLRFYLKDGDARIKIASDGYERLKKDGHEVGDRAKEIISVYKEIIK